MLKACSRCGRVHDYNYQCTHNRPRYKYRIDEASTQRNTHAWHKKSEEIRARADNLCELCKAKGRYVYDRVEVHHIVKVREDPSRLLDDSNLICLCVRCHKQADRGEVDVSYLRELVRLRDGS